MWAGQRALSFLVAAMMLHVALGIDTVSTNYASSQLGAKVVEQSAEASHVRNVLKDDSSYMIVPCSTERKRFTIQLSRDVSVRVVALTSREYFSSIVKTFVLLGSHQFPCLPPSCLWSVLGRFVNNFTRETQYFEVGSEAAPAPPVRYLRMLWASHWGRETSCTLTSLSVYGQDKFELATALPPNVDLDFPVEIPLAALGSKPAVYEGPELPSLWWQLPVNMNVSRCPASESSRDAERFHYARLLDADTCTWNVTRHVTFTADIITSRQLLALKNNLTAVKNALANAVTQEQLGSLKDEVQRLATTVNSHTDSLRELNERLERVDARATQNVLVFGVIFGVIVMATLGSAVSRPPSSSQAYSGAADVAARFRAASAGSEDATCDVAMSASLDDFDSAQ